MLGGPKKSRIGADRSNGLRPLGAEMRPDVPFYAIGDVHGCFEQMQTALARIDADIVAQNIETPFVVFLGDYVDRGPHSAQVLEFLLTLSRNEPDAVICLKGNHEQMMLDFLDNPKRHGPRWLRFGGADTLTSYGITPPKDPSDLEALYGACEELFDALPEGTIEWLRALPKQWSSGNMHCVHAAMDPARTPLDQDADTLLWGHERFLTQERNDHIWVIHGHTVVDQPTWEFGRVALDTGAYYTGRLTAAAFTGVTCRIV